MLAKFVLRWRGIALAMIGVSATLWLAIEGRLGLYIHPRYFMFTVIMVALAALFAVGAVAVGWLNRRKHRTVDGQDDSLDHDHDHGHEFEPQGWTGLWATISTVVVVVTAVAMLVVPPSTLTSSTADSRAMNSSLSGFMSNGGEVDLDAAKERYTTFTVKDWASLLAAQPDPAFYEGMTPNLTGFVNADQGGNEDIFYVSRFVVTCCAVDAQPVGVPVYMPGWQEQFAVDTWVSVTGPIVVAAEDSATLQLSPDSIEAIAEPRDPYVY